MHKVHTPLGGRKDRRTESQKPCPSAFLRKCGGTINCNKGRLNGVKQLKYCLEDDSNCTTFNTLNISTDLKEPNETSKFREFMSLALIV